MEYPDFSGTLSEMLCSLTEGDTEIPLLCFSGEFKTSASSSPSKTTISSPSGRYPSSSKLELQLSPGGESLLQIPAFPAPGRGEQSTPQQLCYCRRQGRTLQQPLINSPPLPPSSASVQGWWLLPWPGEDQAAQGHYLLQPFLLVFCHCLNAMGSGKVWVSLASWRGGPQPGARR